jgi:hypothetical protein
MTTTPDEPVPGDDEGVPAGSGSAQPEGAPGVELGLSEGGGGTFEPEEDVEPGD